MKIKVLSLKRRLDRRKTFTDFFNKISKLNFEFFDAIDGKDYELTKEEDNLFTNSDYHLYNVHVNSVKCTALSHLKLWETCVSENTPILILEDDITVNIKGYDLKIPHGFDLFFIGQQYTYPNCYAYYVTPNGAKSLINHAKKNGFHRAVDWWLHEFHETCKSEMRLEINIGWLGWNAFMNRQDSSDILLEGDNDYKLIQK